MSELLGRLSSFLARHRATRYWIGYSGGMDSHVLLHLCARYRDEQGGEFVALHINHGLQHEAASWQDHCHKISNGLEIPFQAIEVNAHPHSGESPEEAARNARYEAFSACLRKGDALLLAHHQHDQAETILLQLLRGAGLSGLAGMGPVSVLGEGRLLRPLLGIPRKALQHYALTRNLEWIDDPSNRFLDYDRNYLRHSILPLLEDRWPSYPETLCRSARHMAEADRLLREWGQPLLETLEDEAGRLDVSRLRQQSRESRRWLVRAWLKSQGFRPPSQAYLERIMDETLLAAADKNPLVAWGEAEVRRFRGKLVVSSPKPRVDSHWVSPWDGRIPLQLPDGSVLEAMTTGGPCLDPAKWSSSRIEVRYRQGGERCLLPGRHGRRRLKKLFQEYGVPPWGRDRIPLIYLDDELAAVGDLWVCDPYAAPAGQTGIGIRWSASKEVMCQSK